MMISLNGVIPTADGQPGSIIGPDGRIDRIEFDKLGQALRSIEALGTEAERITRFRWHASGQMSHLILENPATGEQVTEWLFGTTLATSGVARDDLVSGKIWPTGESESLLYNRQGDPTQRTDPNGSVRDFTYDQLGNPLDDRATTVAPGVDGTLRRVSTTYNDRGLRERITTYDAVSGGNVINQVKLDYDTFNQLIADQQEHDGEVDGATPEVGYGYTNGSGNVLRRTSATAPSGTRVDFSYGTSGSLDDVFNRVASLKVNGEADNLVDYDWCGFGRIATLAYPTPDAELSYLKPSGATGTGDAGDDLTGYDRFDRTIRMPWKNGTSGTALADISYGYDRASRRQWRKDLTPDSDREFDQAYTYDTLGQVKTGNRGTLNSNQTAIGGIPQEAEAWRYDEQGNWLDYDKAEDGASAIDQSRRHNQSNQITTIDGNSVGVAYDKNGNMTRIPTGDALTGAPRKLVWNAWDQLVEVRIESTNALIQRNAYDGLFRRTARELADSTFIHQYYNDQWKPIEERKDDATDPLAVYYWGARPGHRDDLIRRDRDTDGNGTLDETLWCLMDYFDPIAILNSSGTVQERYSYSAFGVPLILAPNYSTRGTSSFAWDFLFHGQFTDEETGYQNYGFRYYVPALGRWMSWDPIGERGGLNLLKYSGNIPIDTIDYLGFVTVCRPSVRDRWVTKDWYWSNLRLYATISGQRKIFYNSFSVRWTIELIVKCYCLCQGSDGSTDFYSRLTDAKRIVEIEDMPLHGTAGMGDYMVEGGGLGSPLPNPGDLGIGGGLSSQVGEAAAAAIEKAMGSGSEGSEAIPPDILSAIHQEVESTKPNGKNAGEWENGNPCAEFEN